MRKSNLRQNLVLKLAFIAISAAVIGTPTAGQAQETFTDDIIQFPTDTTVEFEFKGTHGANQSTFGIVNLDTNERIVLYREVQPYDNFGLGNQPASPGNNDLGTPLDYIGTIAAGTVQNGQGEANPLTEYTFRANARYAFFLESVSPTGQTRRVIQSGNNLTAAIRGALNAGTQDDVTGTRLALDDSGLPSRGKDNDFDDFVIEAGGFLISPGCPLINGVDSNGEGIGTGIQS
jgi:hypothetical protein